MKSGRKEQSLDEFVENYIERVNEWLFEGKINNADSIRTKIIDKVEPAAFRITLKLIYDLLKPHINDIKIKELIEKIRA